MSDNKRLDRGDDGLLCTQHAVAQQQCYECFEYVSEEKDREIIVMMIIIVACCAAGLACHHRRPERIIANTINITPCFSISVVFRTMHSEDVFNL